MTRSVGLLVDSPAALEDLADQVAAATSATASATSDPHVVALRFGDVEATLTGNHPGIAGEALARRYRFAIAADMAEGSTQASSQEVRTLREAGRVLRDVVALPALLVIDGQNHRPGSRQPVEGEPPEPPGPGEVGA
jgi:hypothetical protein